MLDAKLDLTADSHLREIRKKRELIEVNREIAEKEKAMVDEWLASENASLEKSIAHHTEMLKTIALSYDFGDKKSRNLPNGVFGFRKSVDTLNVVDDTAALEWARKEGILKVETVERYSKKDLLECVRTRGEIPDGCEYVPGQEQFYVKEER